MKKLFLVIFLILAMTSPVMAATYYVDSGGDDATGDGSVGNPWATLSHACGQVTGTNTIYINNAITDNSRCILPIGVNIDGAGTSTAIITTNYNPGDNHGFIYGSSSLSSDPVAQNSTIENIKIDGDGGSGSYAADRAISFLGRDEITIQNVELEDFRISGIFIACNTNSKSAAPSYWGEGIDINNVTLTNCSAGASRNPESSNASGCIEIEATKDATVHDITINNDYTGAGTGIKHTANGWHDGISFYNLNITCDQTDPDRADRPFAIEIFNLINDSAIYDSTFYNGISLVRGGQNNLVSGSTNHVTFYGNTVDMSNVTSSIDLFPLEWGIRYSEVYNNYILSTYNGRGIVLKSNGDQWGPYGGSAALNHVTVRNNIVENYKYRGILFYNYDDISVAGFDDIKIYNNVFNRNGGTYVRATEGNIHINCSDDNNPYTNIVVRNNIIMNDRAYCVNLTGSHVDHIVSPIITHNYCYGNDNDSVYDAGATAPTINNNTDGDPQLNEFGNKPDPFYRPSSIDSNCVDAGTPVGLPYSGLAPDIGVYELLLGAVPPDPPAGFSIVGGQ